MAAGLFASLGAALDEALAAGQPPSRQGPPAQGPPASRAGPAASAQRGGSAAGVSAAAAADAAEKVHQQQSAVATMYASCAVVFLFYFMKQVFALLLVGALAAAYLHNPARGAAAVRDAAWGPLLSARAAALSAASDAALQRGSLLGALKMQLLDGGVRLLRGRRVVCDFVFFAVAYIDSASDVDMELCALGAFNTWHVLRAPLLRGFAAQHADGGGAGDDGTPR